MALKKLARKTADKQAQGSTRGFLEELFQDFYAQRNKVYRMNFVRGIAFGFGSVIGGTVMVALLLWLLSLFNQLPFVGDIIEGVRRSMESPRR